MAQKYSFLLNMVENENLWEIFIYGQILELHFIDRTTTFRSFSTRTGRMNGNRIFKYGSLKDMRSTSQLNSK